MLQEITPASDMTPQAPSWIVARFGAYMHYAVPRMLHRAGQLERLYTDLYAGNVLGSSLSVIPSSWRPGGLQRMLDRVTPDLPSELVRSFPLLGFQYSLQRYMAKDWESISAVHLWAGSAFGHRVVKAGFGNAGAVFTFNTAALEILRAARERGLFTGMEQTIAPKAYEEDLLAEEQTRHAGWDDVRPRAASTLATIQREADEWALADLILCGSEFVRQGVARCGGPVERCVVVPYGVDTKFTPTERPASRGPLRVLSVGEAGLRKGVTYAYETSKRLGRLVEMHWVGPVNLHAWARQKVQEYVDLVGTVPRSQILPHYEWADVFFLPSVCEGSATVTYEALMCGLPVVTTPNAGSLVENGVNGFIVPVRDTAAMAERLGQLNDDRDLLLRLAAGARQSSGVASLDAYQTRLLKALSAADRTGSRMRSAFPAWQRPA